MLLTTTKTEFKDWLKFKANSAIVGIAQDSYKCH